MRIFFIFFTLTLLFTPLASASESFPRSPGLSSQICIERLEGPGVLNIRETRIVIDDKLAFILVGGQAACAFMPPGKHYIYAESYDPYDPTSKDPKAWSSNKVRVRSQKGDRLEFLLRQAQSSNINQWLIEGTDLNKNHQ